MLSDRKYERVVDVGCADGWFLKTAYQRGLIRQGIGIDVDANMLAACRETFSGVEGFTFLNPSEVPSTLFRTCDLVICTETLEHVSSPQEIIEQMFVLSRDGATVVVSVPIEIGPSVIAKQIGRFLSQKKSASYGYEKYEFRDLLRAGVSWDTSEIQCSHNDPANTMKGHKGFDYRKIDALIRNRFKVEHMEYSPFKFMGKVLNSTVYWICKA